MEARYTTRRRWAIGIGIAASVLLAGCGGGGGGGSSSGLPGLDPSTLSSITIDASNEQTIAQSMGGGARSLGDTGVSLTQSQVVGAADIGGSAAGAAPSVGELTNLAIVQALDAVAHPISVTGVVSDTNCPGGGSISVTGTGTTDSTLDPGDSFQADFLGCTVSGSGFSAYLDGTVSFGVNAASGDPTGFAGDWNYQVTLTYSDWVAKLSGSGFNLDILFDGGLTLDANYVRSTDVLTYTMQGGPWAFKDRVSGKGWGYANLGISYSLANASSGSGRDYTLTVNSMDIASTALDGKVSVQTTTDFQGTEGNPPTVGVLVISGGAGSQVTIDASGGTSGCTPGTDFELTHVDASKTCVAWE